MKINDKVLAAFLVSMGLFSTLQAQQYVSSLSDIQKVALLSVTGSETVPTDPGVGGGGGNMGGGNR